MDATPESFAYRCLPLNIANAHGWELLSPCAFDAVWDGGSGSDAVTFDFQPGDDVERKPVSLFGQGVVTFHVEGIFRTPPGWNLWIGGSPNSGKDGIAPLTGIVETDWSPFTFTMNWRFTRPGHRVHFDKFEPVCFMFPIERAALEGFTPSFAQLDADPVTMEQFTAWSRSRDAFHKRLAIDPPATPADRWQKHYYRGVDVTGRALVGDHRTKLHVQPFDRGKATDVPDALSCVSHEPAPEPAPVSVPQPAPPQQQDTVAELARVQSHLAKREWLLEAMQRHRALVPALMAIDTRSGLSGQEFLELYYAQNRPVILSGEMADWPALSRWTPEYLKAVVGARPVEFQGGRSGNPDFEMFKDAHRNEAPFDAFVDHIMRPGSGNNAYLTAYNSARNTQSLAGLQSDLGRLDKFLDHNVDMPNGMMWIGPAGTFTPLHHDLTNNFIAQVVGRKSIRLAPAAEVGKLYNHRHVFSEITDLEAPDLDLGVHTRLPGLRLYDVLLQPGDILFVPLGWWHQVRSLDFSVTITYTNFLWRNDFHLDYPPD